MAQHDYLIENASGAVVRADINDALSAIVTNNSGSTAPDPSFAHQWWADTSSGILKQRDATNTTWLEVASFDGGVWIPLVDGDPAITNPMTTVDDIIVGTTGGVPVRRPAASQAEMETGTEIELRGMSPLRVAQAVAMAISPGALAVFAMTSAPTGWLKANGAGVLRASYPDLDDAIYCGDGNNATAAWGYRATNSNGSGRSTSGDYLILPDLRGEFLRGWDDGRGVDSGRSLWSYQLDQMQRITGSVTSTFSLGGLMDAPASDISAAGAFGIGNQNGGTRSGANASDRTRQLTFNNANSPSARVSSTTSGETRARNAVGLVCIKY